MLESTMLSLMLIEQNFTYNVNPIEIRHKELLQLTNKTFSADVFTFRNQHKEKGLRNSEYLLIISLSVLISTVSERKKNRALVFDVTSNRYDSLTHTQLFSHDPISFEN